MQRLQISDSVASILTALFQLMQKDGNLVQNMAVILTALASIANVIMASKNEQAYVAQENVQSDLVQNFEE